MACFLRERLQDAKVSQSLNDVLSVLRLQCSLLTGVPEYLPQYHNMVSVHFRGQSMPICHRQYSKVIFARCALSQVAKRSPSITVSLV